MKKPPVESEIPEYQPPASSVDDKAAAELSAGLQRLATEQAAAPMRAGARMRNYFLAGIIIVGPIAATIYLINWVIQLADQHIKPLVPAAYLPDRKSVV